MILTHDIHILYIVTWKYKKHAMSRMQKSSSHVQSSPPIHNLDLQTYSLYDILALFEMTPDTVCLGTIQKAKRRVLFMHPDKSKLPAQYFLFYKQALDIIVRMYENQMKVEKSVLLDESAKVYSPIEISDISKKQMEKTMKHISPEVFHDKFNSIFEKQHGGTAAKVKANSERNAWFSSNEKYPHHDVFVQNSSEMNNQFEHMRTHSRQQGMVRYTGVVPIGMASGTNGRGLYEDQDDDDPHSASQEYISTDPFSKLKFDDLRKVHKDQTIFMVSEQDIDQIPQYNSVQQYEMARNEGDFTPMSRTAAERQMEEQQLLVEQNLRKKQYASQLRTAESAEKNKTTMASFLRIGR
jgi:hypothetical protein